MSTPPRAALPQVLIVEDEPAIAGSMATFLRTRGGFETVIAPDASVAQALLGAHHWDVVVIDQILGRGPSGDMILGTAAGRDPGLPRRTIFMTGDISEETELRIEQTGCYESLAKPFPLARLLEIAREILERESRAPEAERERRQA